MRILDKQHIDKKLFQVVDLRSGDDDAWKDKSPVDRLAGLEIIRQMWSEYDPATARLPRLYTVVEPPRR